jgi:alkylhydroperoxidase family enzyme
LARQGVTEEMYAHVAEAAGRDDYSEQEKVAIEYAERFALDHLAIDDAFFARLREHFRDDEVLDLTICIADYLGFGRLTQVLKLDVECSMDGFGADGPPEAVSGSTEAR